MGHAERHRLSTEARSVASALAIAAALLGPRQAVAGNILRRSASSSGTASFASSAAGAAAAAEALARAQASPLGQAMNAIKAWQSAQASARAAAAASASPVPDGLTSGGLAPVSASGIGMPTQSESGGHVTVDLVQTDPRAIVTWTSFNVGKNTEVDFDQSKGGADAANWVALNRIADPSGQPSQILGSIKADGQVYVINRNGVVFGGTSQVNVGTLVLSGLDFAGSTDQQFLSGALALSSLSFGGAGAGVQVQAGAALKAANGRLVLVGRQVENAGTLQSDDGQVLLAAGASVSLGPSSDLGTLRGLVPTVADGTGTVENSGILSAARGNITLLGGTDRQDGLVTATNGAEKNGSVSIGGSGSVTSFGSGSLTQILPDQGGKKAIGAGDSYKPSSIKVGGDEIDVLEGARLYAPSGTITLAAQMTGPQPLGTSDPALLDTSRIYLGAGASLDVSGLTDVSVAMEQNTIVAQLRANELRDNPLLRSGALRGRTVDFDGRLGGKLSDGTGVAGLAGYYDLIARDVAQLMTAGGSIELDANQIVTRPGSTIDLSGGNLRYADGYVRRTVLVDPSGRRVPIESASLGVPYVGIDGDSVVSHPRWGVIETYTSSLNQSAPRFEAGYTQGSAAGTLSLGTTTPTWYQDLQLANPDSVPLNPSAVAAFRVLEGAVVARTVSGPAQRGAPSGTNDPTLIWQLQPLGAGLVIGAAGDVSISGAIAPLAPGFGPGSAVDPARLYHHVLPAGWFDGKTFSSVSIAAGTDTISTAVLDRAPAGRLTIGSGDVLRLGDFGSFSFSGKSADIEGQLVVPGGKVSLTTLNQGDADPNSLTLHLGASARIDVAGRITNDALDGADHPLRPLKGGSVSLTGGRVLLDAGSVVDVTGGAALDASGARLTRGDGGSITIDVSRYPAHVDAQDLTEPYLGELALLGTLRGSALGKGGSLTLRTGHDVVIGAALPGNAAPGTVLLAPGFFTQGGFASYSIRGGDQVTVAAGTRVSPSVSTFLSPQNAAELHSGTKLADVAQSVVLPAELAPPMQLSLSAAGGPSTLSAPARLTLEAGAELRLAPGSKVQLSGDLIQVGGVVSAPGGAISLSNTGSLAGSGIDLAGSLLAPGYLQTALVGGVPVRSVLPGGTVTFFGRNGVNLEPQAVIDVSGVPGIADLPLPAPSIDGGTRYQATSVAGDAGLVSIAAGFGVLGGKLRLAPGAPGGRGGELDVTALGAPMFVAQKQSAASGGGLWLIADSVDGSGADDLSIAAVREDTSFTYNQALTFAGDVTLNTRRSIQILAPILGTVPGVPANVLLKSSSVSLDGQPALDGLAPLAPAAGAGSFTVDADLIDLSRTLVLGCASGPAGDCSVGGFATARFNARTDIRLSDYSLSGSQGHDSGLISGGEVDFNAAQVYVDSRIASPGSSSIRAPGDPGFLVWSGARIRVTSNGAPAPVPLSFGERLTLRAPDIEQGGVVRAPQGEIRLEGRDAGGQPAGSVNLLPGSVTSASLVPDSGGPATTVPFGSVPSGPVFSGYSQPGESPPKAVKLDAPSVAVAPGAVVDVSGGGSVQGYTFVPGNNGSSDVLSARTDAAGHVLTDALGNPLAAPALGPGLSAPFAIVPGLAVQPMPVGRSSDLRDPRLRVGDQIWLQGVPGVRDGFYTLLPAHYALEPGGLLVQQLKGVYGAPGATFTRPDGAAIAFGYRSHFVRGATGDDQRVDAAGFSPFVVMTPDSFLKYSQIATSDLGQTAAALAGSAGAHVRVPTDAGSIVVAAQSSLSLRGTGRMGAGAGGLLGNLDISAAKIAVVGNGASAPGGYLVLNEEDLTAFGAGSILVGGTRSSSAQGTAVAVTASDVSVDTGGAIWSAPEILLAGTAAVTVADGSRLRAEGTAAVDRNPLLLDGDGALFRLSTGSRVGLSRSRIPAAPAGTLTVGSASLFAAGSLSVEAAAAVSLSPSLAFSTPQLDLASGTVHLGAAAPAGAGGTWLSKNQIEQLAQSTDLLIRGHEAIDLHGSFALGTRSNGQATLPSLTLDTGLLQDEDGGTVSITAGRLTMQDSGASGPGLAGGGVLKLDVDSLVLGPGAVRLAGFGALEGAAGATSIAGSGSLALDGALSLATGSVTAASGARYGVTAGGNLDLGYLAAAGAQPSTALGASLSLQGAGVSIDTSITIPSGTFSANASAGALAVGPHARIDVSGQQVDFFGVLKQSPGGTIQLGAAGDLSVAAGALLDVSGAAQAGTVSITSAGQASLLGTMKATGRGGGSFSLDAGSLPSFSSLDALLGAGGFTDSISIRLRGAGQDLRVEQGQAVAAHDVSLRADDGQVFVAGSIGLDGDASHPAGGRVELSGERGVTLASTARIDARAAASESGGYTPASGQVAIAAGQSGAVQIGGATIDVSGGRSGGGAVVVRAPRAGVDGIAIARLDANVVGATERVVEGLQTWAAPAAIDGTWFATPLAAAAAWLSAAQARYPGGLNGFTLAPAIVVQSTGDLAIAGTISLAGKAGPGYLGFVSGGSIDVQGVVSDGFATADRGAALLATPSASLSFVAGGDLTVEKGAMIRTGTGDIAIRTGGSLLLADSTSVIYTAGRRGGFAPGFLGAPSPAAILGELPVDGGNLDILSGGRIEMPLATQSTSAWLFRYGDTNWGGDAASSTVKQQASWSVVFANFEQGLGALGGGDVRVAAAGEIRQLQVSIPTTGQLTTPIGQEARPSDLIVRGGGDLRVVAGGDLVGGLFMIGEGRADLRAGGSVTPSDRPADLRGLRTAPAVVNQGLPRQVGAIFGLMDAEIEITAAGSVRVEGAYDPALQPQLGANVVAGLGSAFSGYSDRASLDVTALSGAVRYENDPWASIDLTLGRKYAVGLGDAVSTLPLLNAQFASAPPALRLDALQSSVYVEDHFSGQVSLNLAAAPLGTLELLAGQNVYLARSVLLLDVAPAYAHGPLDAFSTNVPAAGYGVTVNVAQADALATNSQRGFVPLHQGDPEPVRIDALSGSVCAQRTASCVLDNPINVVALVSPKPIEVMAGTDVVRGSWQPQNNGPADLSILEAGRDLEQPLVLVTGTGALLLQAGRNLVFGQGGTQPANLLAGGAVYSLGNSLPPGESSLSDPTQGRAVNQALPVGKAADVYLLAGAAGGRVDYDGFGAVYLDPANAHGVVRTYLPELRAWLTALDASRYATLSDAELVRAFDALPQARRELLLDRVYMTELKESGIDYNDPSSPRHQSYDRGFRAVHTLFPADPAAIPAGQGGDIILAGKPVEAEAQANIVLLAPYGSVEVGLSRVPSFYNELRYGGVVTRRGGDVQIMADQNIDLFTSRVFTLQGGDITMWTSDGSITAGAGSKTSVFQRPLSYTMTRDATVAVDAFGLQTGAGIGVLDALGNASGRAASRLDLIAPRGEVNAGDAGIRVVGDLNIAAAVVVGVENIQTTGAASGVPKVEVPNIGSLTAAGQVVQAAAKEGGPAVAQVKNAAADLPSIITVEVVGYETADAPGSKDKEKDKKK